jgi:hypothetical protein
VVSNRRRTIRFVSPAQNVITFPILLVTNCYLHYPRYIEPTVVACFWYVFDTGMARSVHVVPEQRPVEQRNICLIVAGCRTFEIVMQARQLAAACTRPSYIYLLRLPFLVHSVQGAFI